MAAYPDANRFRIIGGQWRGRKLTFPDVEGLRPTPDRVRETLFNWLAPSIAGARCLDLFAGSGALGLEALSRGSAQVTFVDRQRAAIDSIRQHLDLLESRDNVVIQSEVSTFLVGPSSPFDIIFLDPPFRKDLLSASLQSLADHGWLKPGGRAYVESEPRAELSLPGHWTVSRDKKAGDVRFRLLEVV